ncbi:MAG: pseudouridine synthase [Treponema sp.]|nr:pseudouridine synthase [Treponema sp.]
MDKPYVLEETDNYAVVFKPAKMHSESMHSESLAKEFPQGRKGASDAEESDTTIYDWFKKYSGFNENIRLMHRLDFETNGLVLFAKNEQSFIFFKDLQDRGEFIKEYSAICVPTGSNKTDDGFPDNNLASFIPLRLCENSFVINSYFRPYGKGRKLVRPVIEDGKKHKEVAKDKGGFYKTEIIDIKENIFTVRIRRGFRHQIRCHLCWAGFPILNDPLYPYSGNFQSAGLLALRSHALFFTDPAYKKDRECFITPLR